MSKIVELFSNRLCIAMEKENMKPIELANISGINKAAISQYISGKYIAKQDNIFKLAKALNVNPEWLMGYDVPMEKENCILKELRYRAYTVLDNAQALMMECHDKSPRPKYLLKKIETIEKDIKVIKSICLKGEN